MYYFHEGSDKTDSPTFLTLPPPSFTASQPMLFPDLGVAKWFFQSGMAEKSLIQWVADTYMKPDKVFLDIGAHVGTYAWTCGKRASHTYAFECSSKTFCFLAANIALHGMTDKITPVRCALGPHDGTAKVFVRSADGGGNGVKPLNASDAHLPHQSIEMRTLDSFGIDNVGFVKLDVEGFEAEVLQGAVNTLLRSGWPTILFESWGDWKERGGVPASKIRADLFAYLGTLGYAIQSVNSYPDMYLAIHS